MSLVINTLRSAVVQYCAELGTNSLLVQGAGGNVSWKDEDNLWIKASGTWLADAADKDIFIPVDLAHLRIAIKNNDFDATPKVQTDSLLKPSIETFLHALMPHKIVVHIHAIEVLAHLVRDDCDADLQRLLADVSHWVLVDYYKPGKALAQAVSSAISQNPQLNVVFLRNHGLVIGGADIHEVDDILRTIIRKLNETSLNVPNTIECKTLGKLDQLEQYTPISDVEIHELATNPQLFNKINLSWALYPDHVVFLGPQAHTYENVEEFLVYNKQNDYFPELIFIQGSGVYIKPTFNRAKHAQLRCYYDVVKRLELGTSLRTLSRLQISELLNWDAELYRMEQSK